MNGPTIFQQIFDVPIRDGRVVAMCNYRDRLIIATEAAIYEAHIDDREVMRISPVYFAPGKDGKP